MKFHHDVTRALMVLAAACTLGAGAAAAGQPNELTFGIGAPVLIDSTAPYASVPTAMGYWKAQGLTVHLQPTQGATASMQLLLAGRADIVNGGSSSFYQEAAKAPQIRVISLQMKNIWQVTVPEGSAITSISELRGKTIGVQSFSSASYLFGRAAIAASGINPDTGVHWLPVGVGSQAAQAFRSGTIAAYATYDGPSGVIGLLLQKKMVNLPTPLDKVPGLLGYATTEKFLKEHRDLVVKFLMGVYEGAIFSAANPAAALQIQWKTYPEQKPRGMTTEQAIEKTLPTVETRFKGGATPGSSGLIGDVPVADVQESIDFLVKYDVLKKALEAKNVVDMSMNAAANKFDASKIKTQAEHWKP